MIERYNRLHFRMSGGRVAEARELERLPVEAWHAWLDAWEENQPTERE